MPYRAASNLALLGGRPVRREPLPPVPIIGDEERQAVIEVLEGNTLSAAAHTNIKGGAKAQKFEAEFAEHVGSRHAIAVNSGTAALHVALAAAGVGPGDEVLIPSYTFTATASAVLMHNAIPVFIDVDPLTFCIDPKKAEEAVTSVTKAIIPVHLLGNMADMGLIMALAKRCGLKVIEDTAQAPGASFDGQLAGTIGTLGTYSFQESKNMMTGEGGMVVTDEDDLAYRCRLIRNHGEAFMEGRPRSYIANVLGWNYRMTEIEAAIGLVQLSHLDEWNEIRRFNGAYLSKQLAGSFLTAPHVERSVKHVYHLFGMLYDERVTRLPRNVLQQALNAEGIPFTTGYPHPLYRNPMFQERLVYGTEGCPFTCRPFSGREVDYKSVYHEVAESLCSTLAVWTNMIRPPMGMKDLNQVVEAVTKVSENLAGLRSYPTK